MTIPELLARLTKLYPLGGTEAWQEEYRRLLKPFAGPALDKAWDSVMASWDKGFPPKPADIRKHCRQEKRGTARHVEGREAWAMVDRRCDEMVDDWFRDNPEVGTECQQNISLLGLVRDRLRKIAFMAAQKEALGSPNPHLSALEYFGFTDWLPAEELQRMRELVQAWGRAPESKEFKRMVA